MNERTEIKWKQAKIDFIFVASIDVNVSQKHNVSEVRYNISYEIKENIIVVMWCSQ